MKFTSGEFLYIVTFLKLPFIITFAYELRFTRTTRPRTRIDELYNFREESFPKFETYKKVKL